MCSATATTCRYSWALVLATLLCVSGASQQHRVLYQTGNSDEDLPECGIRAVCSKVDVYAEPWSERVCRCPATGQPCPGGIRADDGHTLADRTRRYKLCEPVKRLPKCRYFRDTTWTLLVRPDNVTEQIVHCRCPRDAVTYLVRRASVRPGGGLKYAFACSPQSRLRCQRKAPCRLFTVRKRAVEALEEVTTSTLCQCPPAHRCPRHHVDSSGVVPGRSYPQESVRTYSAYCTSESTQHPHAHHHNVA